MSVCAHGSKSQYPQHLSSAYGSFDGFQFDAEATNFDGVGFFDSNQVIDFLKREQTLFILPLKPTIFQETDDMLGLTHNLLKGPYSASAADGFFFTNLERISAGVTEGGGFSLMWTTNATKSTGPNEALRDGCSVRSLLIQRPDSPLLEEWIVATSGGKQIPSEHHNIAKDLKLNVSRDFSVNIAINVGQPQPKPLETPMHLFSTLPFPAKSHLPFHINAVFSTSSNRQGIVLHPPDRHQVREPKSAFNAWVFSDPITHLYLSVLEYLNTKRRKLLDAGLDVWYLEYPLDSADEVADIVSSSFRALLPTSPHTIFRTTSGRLVPFSDALFSHREPHEVTNVLKQLNQDGLVRGFRSSRILSLRPEPRTVQPADLVHILAMEGLSEKLMQSYKSGSLTGEDMDVLAEYAVKVAPLQVGALLRLPFLAVEDSLLRIPSGIQPPVYVSMWPKTLHSLFIGLLFIKRRIRDFQKVLIESPEYNVRIIAAADIPALVSTRLRQLQPLGQDRVSAWIKQLWLYYDRLPGPPALTSVFANLDIVETTTSPVSIAECTPTHILHHSARNHSDATRVLVSLGIKVLEAPSHPTLHKLVQDRFPDEFVLNVIQCLQTYSKLNFAAHLDKSDADKLAKWLKGEIALLLRTPKLGDVGPGDFRDSRFFEIF